ncbi:hypothetical protein PR048_020568 [Dryococelus australis]|uniref:Parvovirus non-structural protein 1 helicase domain-containing protein n=1 Tax=Dryococelus australis TaxID=614101 RepID=A0ABQ9H6M5_9NEOP|nr:hypothetical protein PR048_020568 [Dryococelus australis]
MESLLDNLITNPDETDSNKEIREPYVEATMRHDQKTLPFANRNMERDRTGVHFDQLPSITIVLFEEPLIDNSNVVTWKLLLEGAHITTDIKHRDKEVINRMPVFLTTNARLHIWCEAVGCPSIRRSNNTCSPHHPKLQSKLNCPTKMNQCENQHPAAVESREDPVWDKHIK